MDSVEARHFSERLDHPLGFRPQKKHLGAEACLRSVPLYVMCWHKLLLELGFVGRLPVTRYNAPVPEGSTVVVRRSRAAS